MFFINTSRRTSFKIINSYIIKKEKDKRNEEKEEKEIERERKVFSFFRFILKLNIFHKIHCI